MKNTNEKHECRCRKSAIYNNVESQPQKRWLSLREAKTYANCRSDQTIRKWLSEGKIDGCRRTGSWVIDRESIDKWFIQGEGI